MVRQVGVLNCTAVAGGAGFSFYSLLFCYGSDGIYAIDPLT